MAVIHNVHTVLVGHGKGADVDYLLEVLQHPVALFQKMLGDENFSPEELDAIAFGYTRLLEERDVYKRQALYICSRIQNLCQTPK